MIMIIIFYCKKINCTLTVLGTKLNLQVQFLIFFNFIDYDFITCFPSLSSLQTLSYTLACPFSLDIQFLCSCTEKTVYPTSRFHHLLIVLCVALRSLGLFPIQFGMSIVSSFFNWLFSDHVGETIWVFFLMFLWANLMPRFVADKFTVAPPSSQLSF